MPEMRRACELRRQGRRGHHAGIGVDERDLLANNQQKQSPNRDWKSKKETQKPSRSESCAIDHRKPSIENDVHTQRFDPLAQWSLLWKHDQGLVAPFYHL